MSTLNFDANDSTIPEMRTFDPLPAGDYMAVITEGEMKPTKNGDGQYLQLTFEVVDGPFKGRKHWSRLNLVNQNPEAVGIARAELKALCKAIKLPRVDEPVELYNLPMIITIKHKRHKETGEINANISAYKEKGSAVALPPPVAGQQSVAPWAKKA